MPSVRPDPSDDRGQVNDRLGLEIRHHPLDLGLVGQIVVLGAERREIPVALGRKRGHEMGPEEPGSSGHDDTGFGMEPESDGRGSHPENLMERARKVKEAGLLGAC